MTGRAKHKLPQNTQFPGPGSYDGNFEAVVRRQPVFSMATRFKVPTDENMKPGAGTYRPEKVRFLFVFILTPILTFILTYFFLQINLGHVPCFSFGIKHSQYLGSFAEVSY